MRIGLKSRINTSLTETGKVKMDTINEDVKSGINIKKYKKTRGNKKILKTKLYKHSKNEIRKIQSAQGPIELNTGPNRYKKNKKIKPINFIYSLLHNCL